MDSGVLLRGRYRLVRLLGRGGMAEVYLATDTLRQAEVAVKVLREDLAEDPQFLQRFQREAEALSRLDHPNVVRFYSFERQGSTAFIVMDYVPGTTLRGRLAEADGPLPLEEITSVLGQVTAALYYAHSQGYVHRDIKPGNIILREDGTALLSDFGIARATEASTMTQAPLGTPAYMSPEQILGHPVDARSDIYSLGVVLYEAATGHRPFSGEMGTGTSTAERVRDEHLHMLPPDPRRLNPLLAEGSARVILKALAKDPSERWQDAVSMARAWQQVIDQETRLSSTPATIAPVPSRPLAPAQGPYSPPPAGETRHWEGAPMAAPPGGTPAKRGSAWALWLILGAAGALIVGGAVCAFVLANVLRGSATPTRAPTALVRESTPVAGRATREPTARASTATLAPTAEAPTPTSTPTRTATPEPQSHTGPIRVLADGSGDYPDLRVALEAAAPGATIELGPGTFFLDEPLVIDKELTLLGDGLEVTEIVSEAEGSVVSILADFTAKGLSFRHEGSTVANVVVVESGHSEFINCRFSGAIWDSDTEEGGDGLLFRHGSTGRVSRSRAEGNALYGFEVVGSAYAAIEGCIATGNDGGGVSLWDSATADVSDCTCSGNGYHGIAINGSASANLTGNTCSENQYSGIAYFDEGSGKATGNECSDNGYHGIAIEDQASPTLEENTCTGNYYSGIYYFDQGGGAALRNQCHKNGYHGIDVEGEAQPTLEENECTDNSFSGIAYFGTAGGAARGNYLAQNGYHGIGVNGSATPVLENNKCLENEIHGIGVYDEAAPTINSNTSRGNKDSGIGYFDSSGGSASGNSCGGNGMHGIAVTESAAPELIGNVLYDNDDSGLAYFDTAAGLAIKNEMSGNSNYGIYVAESARPYLDDNNAHDNGTRDVFDARS